MIVAVMMLPILVVVLLNDIEHGDDVHRPQQLVPSLLVHVTDIAIDAFGDDDDDVDDVDDDVDGGGGGGGGVVGVDGGNDVTIVKIIAK